MKNLKFYDKETYDLAYSLMSCFKDLDRLKDGRHAYVISFRVDKNSIHTLKISKIPSKEELEKLIHEAPQ